MTLDTSECEESRRLRRMMLDANKHSALLRTELAEAENIATRLIAKQRQHKDACPVCQASNRKPESMHKNVQSIR